jgi:hypothetical protein
MQTVVGPEGVETVLHPAPGELAFLETELHLSGHDALEGSGILTFGEDGNHELRLATIHAGHLGPSTIPGVMAGAMIWKISGGTGRFQSASGLIASTFTMTESGELSEFQCGVLYVAE